MKIDTTKQTSKTAKNDLIDKIYVNYRCINSINDENFFNDANIAYCFNSKKENNDEQHMYIYLFVYNDNNAYKIYIGNKNKHYDITKYVEIKLTDIKDHDKQQQPYQLQIHKVLQDGETMGKILQTLQQDYHEITVERFLQMCEKCTAKEEIQNVNHDNNISNQEKRNNNFIINAKNDLKDAFTRCLATCCDF